MDIQRMVDGEVLFDSPGLVLLRVCFSFTFCLSKINFVKIMITPTCFHCFCIEAKNLENTAAQNAF